MLFARGYKNLKKRFIALFLVILSVLMLFASCNEDDEIPSGMKFANSKDTVDYSLFVPKEWIIDTANSKITLAHVSNTDSTSINVQKLAYTSIDSWWTAMEKSLKGTYSSVSVTQNGEDIKLAGHDAKKYVATGIYGENGYHMFEMYGVLRHESVYSIVITYPCKENNGTSYTNEFHKETITEILSNFKFNDGATGGSEPSYEHESTPSGMKLASDTKIVDYLLFVPSYWTVENPVCVDKSTISSAYVYDLDKNINLNIMQWNKPEASYSYVEWWYEYKNQLLNSFKSDTLAELEYQSIKIADIDSVFAEFSCNMGSSSFKYRVYTIDHAGSVHVMTFTIRDTDSFEKYEDDIGQILSNFRFN